MSSHNANIIAKDTQPDIVKDRWPNFQDFIEEIVNDLIGDTRAAREPAKVDCSATEQTIVKLFEKKKVCCECSLTKALGEGRGMKLVREQIDKLKLNSDHIVNMDEVPLMFDIPMNRTVDVQGPEVLPPDMKNVNSPWYLPVQTGAKNYHPW